MHSDADAERAAPPVSASIVRQVALAWLPLFLLWTLFILTYSPGRTLGSAFLGALNNVGWAAVLGIGAWWVTGRFPWPDELRPRFYWLHLAAGSLFSASWILATYSVATLLDGRTDVLDTLRSSRVLGWHFILGFILYGLVAGVSYALRTRRQLREQERVAARAQALAAEARLQALRAKLHPHFLFNCLHSLSELIGENAAAAERAVERLGDLLRYALDEHGEEVVPLSDEWAFTRDYLELERLRYGPRLRLETDFDAEALNSPLPPFTLQPLVENALRHAVAERTEGGVIRVTGRLEADRLRLTVADDGPGVDARTLDGARGLGLRSVRQRLRYLYGDQAGVAVVTSPGSGFSVTISLPAESVEPEASSPASDSLEAPA